jgi:hypothetical protein
MLIAELFGLGHATGAEIPLRHDLPLGKLHHRAWVKA